MTSRTPTKHRLADDLAEERSVAIRLLLRSPLLDSETEPEHFRLVVRHQTWLVAWFEETCGWRLTVDTPSGFARLAKRAARIDQRRPLHRSRGSKAPFDRRRYQLLCLIAAELVRHPVTTVGFLAGAITPEAQLDSSRRSERSAFVDALNALIEWGALRTSGGDVASFVDSDQANALLTADTARLHHLLVAGVAPSSLPPELDTGEATAALLREGRYGDAATDYHGTNEDQRLRWARHQLARRLLDDPAVHTDELLDGERDYLTSISGRRWLRDRVTAAGFEWEARAEGVLAIDPEGIATDDRFPAPHGNVHQCALLLTDRFLPADDNGTRALGRLSDADVLDEVTRLLEQVPGWAKAYREGAGPRQLAHEAIELLCGFGLLRREPDGTYAARPALARYRAGEPTIRSPDHPASEPEQANLFDLVP